MPIKLHIWLKKFILKVVYANFCGRCGGLFCRSRLYVEKEDLVFKIHIYYCVECFDIRKKFEKQRTDRKNCENCNRIREESGRQKLFISYKTETEKPTESQNKTIIDRYLDKEFRIFIGKGWCSIHQ